MRAILLLCLLHAASAQLEFPVVWPFTDDEPENVCKKPSSCSCCLILQEVNDLNSHFNSTLDKLEREHSQTLTELNELEARRTAFSVALNYPNFKCFGPKTTNATVIYDHVFLNLGNRYSVSTGIFTALHSGVYVFALTIHGDSGAPGSPLAACAQLVVNNKVVAQTSEQNDEDQQDGATNVVVVQLKAGDKVSVTLPKGCSLCQNKSRTNTYTGFLLFAN